METVQDIDKPKIMPQDLWKKCITPDKKGNRDNLKTISLILNNIVTSQGMFLWKNKENYSYLPLLIWSTSFGSNSSWLGRLPHMPLAKIK